MRTTNTIQFLAVLALAATVGMLTSNLTSRGQTAPPAAPPAAIRAVCVMGPTKGNSVTGVLWFDTTPDGVHIHGTISGLAPNSVHGFHIHEFGDLTKDDGTAAGGHFNPTHQVHGGPGSGPHMAGDLGNVKADDSGTATVDLTSPDISIADGANAIVGRSVVVHTSEDDLTPKANPGARIGIGVIGYAKPQ
jgi:superoxide dismutase, Cu-Zn family